MVHRRGRDLYEVLSTKSDKLVREMRREEILNWADCVALNKGCEPLLKTSLDPDFTTHDIDFSVLRVMAVGGVKCRYVVRCEFED